jgi:peptidoglycan hydrolase-like protein with peptidoglycan-binding domain
MKVLVRLFVLLVFASSVALADDAILAAQQKLQKLGYYSGTPDGQYGSQTAAAIRRYQVAKNLKVTGDLTPQTLKSLGISAPAPKQAPVSKPAPVPSSANTAPAATPVPQYVAIANIFKGGPYITAPTEVQIATIQRAQKNLKLLGYYAGPNDGQVTSNLVASIKAWQKSAGFRQTGRFDESTLKGLDLMGN